MNDPWPEQRRVQTAAPAVPLAWRHLAAALTAIACSGDATSSNPPVSSIAASIAISPEVVSLAVPDTLRLIAVVKDAGGKPLARTVTWRSESPALATVSADGLVTGLAPGGPFYITATADGQTAGAALSVTPRPNAAPIATLTTERPSVTMALRQSHQVFVTARDATGQLLYGRAVSWTSSTPSVVAVNSAGMLTALQPGSVSVVASSEGKALTVTVTVVALASIDAGYAETCAISTTGRLYCAGAREGNRAKVVAENLRFASVFASKRLHDVTCAITTDQALYCWGENAQGELGVGDTVRRDVPTRVVGDIRFKTVSSGQGNKGGLLIAGVQYPFALANHTCGLSITNDVYCWGDGRVAQFGQGNNGSLKPEPAGSGRKFTEVVAGRMYSCGVGEDGRTYCWGDNEAGHTAQRTWSYEVPTSVPTVVAGVTLHGLSGGGATCGLAANGDAYCWGDNTLGKIGAATTELCFGLKPCSTSPTLVQSPERFTSLHSTQYSTCALSTAGTVYCWGMNIDSKFGVVTPPACFTPNSPAGCTTTPTAGPSGFLSISGGPNNLCGFRQDGGAYCWGGNQFGQLGYPVSISLQPVPFSLDPDTPP